MCFGVMKELMPKQGNIKPIPRTRSKILIGFSNVASFVFHPLIIVTYVFIGLYVVGVNDITSINANVFWKWFAIIFIATVFLPFLAIMLLRITRLISDAFMHSPKDRILPLIATLIFYTAAFYFFEQEMHSVFLLRSLLLGAIFSIILDFCINFFYKVSVHTTAAGMMPGSMLVLVMINSLMSISILLIAFLLAAIVGFIRWWLGAHTLGQIFLGYVIGICMQLLSYLVLK